MHVYSLQEVCRRWNYVPKFDIKVFVSSLFWRGDRILTKPPFEKFKIRWMVTGFWNSRNSRLGDDSKLVVRDMVQHHKMSDTEEETTKARRVSPIYISICDSKIQVSSVEKLLGVTISNTLCWDAHIDQLIKSVILIYSYCRE